MTANPRAVRPPRVHLGGLLLALALGACLCDAEGDPIVEPEPIPPNGFDPGPVPTDSLRPATGEVTIVQLDLPGRIKLGEAAVIVGPDGTLVLLDVGNDTHAEVVREVVRDLNTRWLVPERGFIARAPLQVEWIVLTHFHADHVGAFADLLLEDEPLEVVHGVVHRGFVDVGPGTNADHFETICQALRGPLARLDASLCTSGAAAPCEPAAWSGPHPAERCDGLTQGDLSHGTDAGEGVPTWIDLGGGARLTLLGAAAHFVGPDAVHPAPPFGHDATNQENARSLVGLVSHGAFRYHFGGDLTGEGTEAAPDVEAHLTATSGHHYHPHGADVTHAHHHGRHTSSSVGLVDMLAPADGRSRNVVAGINQAYVRSPHAAVLENWLDGGRLGDGWFWATHRAPYGSTHARFIDAEGEVVVQTVAGGRGYWVQAPQIERAQAYPSVRDVAGEW